MHLYLVSAAFQRDKTIPFVMEQLRSANTERRGALLAMIDGLGERGSTPPLSYEARQCKDT